MPQPELTQLYTAVKLRIAAAAARSKRTDAELLSTALGVGPDLGNEVRHAAGALLAHRNGALVDWPAQDVERAARFLAALEA